MTDLDERLARCFLGVFPALEPDQVTAASTEVTPGWDSLHALMLIAILEETFELEIPTSAYPGLRSYTAVRRYVEPFAGRDVNPETTANHPGVADPERRE